MPIIPKLFLILFTTDYSQNNSSILDIPLCVANYVYIITYANIAYIYLMHNMLWRLVHAVTTICSRSRSYLSNGCKAQLFYVICVTGSVKTVINSCLTYLYCKDVLSAFQNKNKGSYLRSYVCMYTQFVYTWLSIHMHMFVKYIVTQQSSAYGVNVSLAVVGILPEVDNCWSSAYFIYNKYICYYVIST